MFKKMRKSKKGFTLTELIVVIAILGVLAAVVTPSVLGYLNDAKTSADQTNLTTIDSCVKRLAARGLPNGFDAKTSDKATIIAAIKKEINPIPASQDATMKWLFTRDDAGTTVGVTQVVSTSVTPDDDLTFFIEPDAAPTAVPTT